MSGSIRSASVGLFLSLVALAACSSSDDTDAAAKDSGTSASTDLSAAEGKAVCYAVCDTQLGLKCPNLSPQYGDQCRLLCDSAYAKAPPECASRRASYDVCSRDRVTYGCGTSGTFTITPTGACTAQAIACSSCSSTAGLSCFGLF